MTSVHLFLQVALLALVSGALGGLCGRYVWPRYTNLPGTTSPPASHDLDPALSDLEERLLASESQLEQLRTAVAQALDEPSDETDDEPHRSTMSPDAVRPADTQRR
jgi:hypothetical protein